MPQFNGIALSSWAVPHRPFDRDGRVRRLSPVLAIVVIAIGAAIVDPPAEPVWFGFGAILAAGALLAALVLPWERLSERLDPLPPLVLILAVGPLRHGVGGASSGYAPLVLLGILWLSLHGTRRQLVAGVALATTVLLVPVLLLGGSEYPIGEWRRVAVVALVGGLTGFMIQRLTAEIRAQTVRLVRQGEEIGVRAASLRSILDGAGDAVVSVDEAGRIEGVNVAASMLLGRPRAELVGRPIVETVIAPEQRGRMRAGLARLLAEASPQHGGQRFETEVVGPDGQPIPIEITVTVTGQPGARSLHVFGRDITARRSADVVARQHLDDLGRLLAVARDLGRPASGPDGRHAICEAARDLADADLALFFETRSDEDALVATGSAGSLKLPDRIALDPRTSLTARIVVSGEQTFVGDLLDDPRVDRATAVRLGVRAAFWQPILRDGRPIGVLVVYWREPRGPLTPRVASLLELFATQAAAVVERADLIGRLEDLARTDELTGLANRRALDEALVRSLAVAERSGRPVSIVLLDLDRFKVFNDSFGHPAGDRLLRETARAWQAVLRPSDTLARFGGEEFLAVIPDTDAEAASVLAERLRVLVPERQSASAGVATWNGHEAMADLVARADAALYRAKRAGRDRVMIAGADEPLALGPSGPGAARPTGRRPGLRALPDAEDRPAV